MILEACAMQIMKIEKLSSRIPIRSYNHRPLITERNMSYEYQATRQDIESIDKRSSFTMTR